MARNSRIAIEKFNGHNFELWKLRIEDISRGSKYAKTSKFS
jgi:hypothetical protein